MPHLNIVIKTRDTTKADRVHDYFKAHPELKAKPVPSKFSDKPFAYNVTISINRLPLITSFLKGATHSSIKIVV
jgi:hypothetical protein